MGPVVHRPNGFELVVAEVGDIALDEPRGVLADLHREVLAMDAERIEAHGLEDVVPTHTPVAPLDIGAREGEHVPHVQPLGRGVREHHQVEEGFLGIREVNLVDAVLLPAGLPLGGDSLMVEGAGSFVVHRAILRGQKMESRRQKIEARIQKPE